MNRGLKRFLIICAVAAGVGLVFTVAGFALGGIEGVDKVAGEHDWLMGSPGEMRYMDVDCGSDLDAVKIQGDMDVRISRGDHDSARICYGENWNVPVTRLENGTLFVDARVKEHKITINFTKTDYEPFIEITCKESGALENVYIETESGDVDISGIETDSITVFSEYGDVRFDGVGFNRGELSAEMGDIECKNIKSYGLKIENENGDCKLSGEILGTCEVEIENGDLYVDTTLAENMYRVEAETEMGEMHIGDMHRDDYECRYNGGSGSNILKLFSECGDVKVNFGVDNHGHHE